MLRIVMLGMLAVAGVAVAELPEYQDPSSEQIDEQKKVISKAMKSVDGALKSGEISKLLAEETAKIDTLKSLDKQVFTMPEYVDEARNQRYMKQAFEGADTMATTSSQPALKSGPAPMVLISLSMPESTIKALIHETFALGGGVVVRGLVEGDFEKTITRIRDLAGKNAGGIMIDPTLFKRFKVARVPAFVLPLQNIEPCTSEGCPVPEHVKATGAASLRYFLDLVYRTGNEVEQQAAGRWLVNDES